ncbi:hypothetical protein [Lolliginicoccus suaedae]|uniref:hypothetical protein n=1 Tax=Lolliginicoccus suaedae TaxID=2605429 RepID=UPI0011ED5C76|nr:hypothetical protein [Lolliginicoccus suaedae]
MSFPVTRTTALRVAMIATGIAAIGYGALLALSRSTPEILSAAIWFGGGIIIHDALIAPLSLAVGYSGRTVLPRTWWAPIATAGLCTATLLAVAVPVLGREGARPDNPTVLDRDYTTGLAIAVGAIWVIALLLGTIRARRHEQNR